MQNLTMAMFIDCGMVEEYYAKSEKYLSGFGIKTTFSHQYFDASFTYAKPMRNPDEFEAKKDIIYASVNFKLPF